MLLSAFNGSDIQMYNGAVGGTNSMYMALCLHVSAGWRALLHILDLFLPLEKNGISHGPYLVVH